MPLALFRLLLVAILGLDVMGTILLLSPPIGLMLHLADREVLGRLHGMVNKLVKCWGRRLLCQFLLLHIF